MTEDKAANTLENVRLGMDALRRSGVSANRLLLVAKGFVMRRCVATFAGQFDALTVVPCPPPAGLEASLDRSGSDFSARLASEVVRLERYAAKGNIRHEEVPAAIRSLVARIREKHPRLSVLLTPTAGAARPRLPTTDPRLPVARQRWSACYEERLPETARRRRC